LDAAFVDVGLPRNVFLYVGDAIPEDGKRRRLRGTALPKISEILHAKQELLVQVTKSPIGKKGARATARISLPGRYLVLMANSGRKVGVSKKITDEQERERLRQLGEKIRPEEYGIIIRTQAEGVGQKELAEDVAFLAQLWDQIQRKSGRHRAPALLHEDLSLVYGVLRDVFDERSKAFVVDNDDVHRQVLTWLETMGPGLRDRVQRYDKPEPIFEHYEIETEIERALRPKVWMPHGGWIQVDQGEALTMIDVNTGRFTKTGSLADTVLRTNLEAVEEVGRQLRLRDIGGIIVVDFIDMDSARHRQEVMEALRRVLKNDRMRTRVIHLTPLGLVEMTRKRTGDSLPARLEQACPCCAGRGRILSAETVAVRVAEDLARRVREHPDVGDWTVTESNIKYEKVNVTTIEFPLEIPANAERSVTYTIRY
jgi:ribonuclease G